MRLGYCDAADSNRTALSGGDAGRAQSGDGVWLFSILSLSGIQMNGDGVGNIKVHEAVSAVRNHLDRNIIPALFVHGQRTVADDIQARAVEIETVVDEDHAEFILALDIELEVIAHIPDEKLIVSLMDILDGQGVGCLVVGHTAHGAVVDLETAVRVVIIDDVEVLTCRRVINARAGAAKDRDVLRRTGGGGRHILRRKGSQRQGGRQKQYRQYHCKQISRKSLHLDCSFPVKKNNIRLHLL